MSSLTQRKPSTGVERSTEAEKGSAGDESHDTNAAEHGKKSKEPGKWSLSILVLVVMLLCLSLSYAFLPKLLWLKCATLSPAAFCFWMVIEPNKERPLSQRILPLVLVTTTFSAHLPVFLGAAFAALGILAFGLSTIPAMPSQPLTATEKPIAPESALPVVTAALLLVGMLLADNFFVWVVAATFTPGQSIQSAPKPLQDNGQLVLRWVLSDLTKRQVVGLRRLWNVQWGLVACLGASLVSVDLFRTRGQTLYRVSRRAVLTLAVARFLRVVCFCLTVLPSQSKNCYVKRFPVPPPEEWLEWIMVGLRPYSHGGCNDLVISGHATVVSVLACVSASVGTEPLFQACLWSLVVLDFMVEIYEGFHYSVDMFLGAVLVCLLWRVLAPTKNLGTVPPPRRQSLASLSTLTISLYAVPVLGSYLQLTILPPQTVIAVIVLYAAVAIGCLLSSLRHQSVPYQQAVYQHRAQHVLLSLLFLALGFYM
jgi:hypothetical protein